MLKIDRLMLPGSVVQLLPLSMDHLDALCEVGLDPDIWRWTPTRVRSRADMRTFIEQTLEAARANVAVPFTTTLRDSARPIGMTRFMNMALEHRRVEIGGTWIAPAWQRTRVNSEAKFLMLRHAFEVWQCMRVEFKTNALNAPSRAAILRLGAIEEGTLRKHLVNDDGTVRDTVYFSILDHEWPRVKQRLEARLALP